MRTFVAFLLIFGLFAAITPMAEAQQPRCIPHANEQVFWQDDFKVEKGWTHDNNVNPANGGVKPNQWQYSEEGNGDIRAWYIGREGPAGETGYLSNHQGPATNNLFSPTIDARLWQITCIEYDLMGSSEGNADGSDMTDWLQVDLFMPGLRHPGANWQGIASYSGQSHGHAYSTLGAPVSPNLDIESPPVNPVDPALEFAGGDYIRLRFAFHADGSVDSFSPPCTREVYEANGNQCTAGTGDPSGGAGGKKPTQNMAGYGWFVDNVKIWGTPLDPDGPGRLQHKDRLNQFPNNGPEFTSFEIEMQRIDIIRDAGLTVPITIQAKDDTAVVSADVFLINGDDEIQVSLINDAVRPRDWTGELEVDDVRLTVGEWTAIAFIADERGNLTRAEDSYTVSVTADDAHLYPLIVGLAGRDLEANPEVALAAGSSLQIVLEEDTPILRDIRFQMVRQGYTTPPLTPIGAPYVLTAEQFPQAEFDLVMIARDRAHQTGTLSVPVVNDQTIPQVGVIVPPVTYQNVEFQLAVWVKEQTSHQVRFQMDDQLLSSESTIPSTVHFFNFTRTEIENGAQFKITVHDRMSNSKTIFGTVDTLQATADAMLTLATVPNEPKYMPGDPVQLLATLTDLGNARAYPYEVIFMKENNELASLTQSLTPGIPANFLHSLTGLRPGIHTVDAFARTDASYEFELDELLDDTEEASKTLEIYLGKVIFENKTWYIRADARGQPYEALNWEFDFHYPLRLVDTEDGPRYFFKVGQEQYYWNPLNQTTIIPSPEGEPEPPREVPGVPLVILLAALAFMARRKS